MNKSFKLCPALTVSSMKAGMNRLYTLCTRSDTELVQFHFLNSCFVVPLFNIVVKVEPRYYTEDGYNELYNERMKKMADITCNEYWI